MSVDVSNKIDLTKSSPRNYAKFFLNHNPFPPLGVPGDIPLFTVDRDLVVKRFVNTISEIRTTGNSVLTVMVGENGGGKSHIFKLFKHTINLQLTKEDTMLASYVKNPGNGFVDLFKTMIDNIGKTYLQNIVEKFVKDEIIKNKELQQYFKPHAYEKFTRNEITLHDLVLDSQYLNIINKFYENFFTTISNKDIVHVVLCLIHPELSLIAWRWILGDKIEKIGKNRISLQNDISPENAYRLFNDFIKTLKIIGVQYFALFIDELEDITTLNKLKLNSYQNDLRQLIDDNPNNLCLYFAITPQQWKKLANNKTALTRRLSINWFILDEFDEEETRSLIEQYLYHSRSSSFSTVSAKNKFPDCEASLCPFTTESICAIHKRTKGVISEVLKLGRGVLEEAYDNNEDTTISASDIDNFKYISGSA